MTNLAPLLPDEALHWPSPVDWLELWRRRPRAIWDAEADRRVVCCWCFHTLIQR